MLYKEFFKQNLNVSVIDGSENDIQIHGQGWLGFGFTI